MSTSDVKVIGDYTAAVTIDGSTHFLLIQPGSAATAYKKISRNILLGVTGQPADTTTVQTVQNKVLDNTNTVTVKDTLFTLQDDGDTTKQARFQLSAITTATTRTYTLPNASSTIADLTTAQTFTNKTLTSPAITGGTYANGTITVDAIGGFSSANIVTVAGLQINNGVLNTNNSVVTANITDAAVTPAKLIAGTGSGWSWQSFSPSISNLTTGNGTLVGSYIQIGKTVFFRVGFTLGSTSAVGTTPVLTLPVTSVAYPSNSPIGLSNCLIAASNYSGTIISTSTTTATPVVYNTASTYANLSTWTAAVPAAWANGDKFSIIGSYEAA